MSDVYGQFLPTPTGGSGGMTNPMTALGDVIYGADGSGTPGRLPIGLLAQCLTVQGGIPTWAPLPLAGIAAGSVASAPLLWTGAAWSNALLPLAGIAAGGVTNAPIVWTGAAWSNALLSLSGLAQGGATTGQVVTWSGSAWGAAAVPGMTPGTVANAPWVWTGAAWVNTLLPLAGLAQGGATSGQVPTWSGSAWVPQTPSGGLAAGSVTNAPLVWSGSAWVNQLLPLSGNAAGTVTNAPIIWTGAAWSNALLPLSGVAQSAATSGQVPTWSGSAWVPQTPASGGASTLVLIARVVPPAAQVFTLASSIPQTYNHLLITYTCRSSVAALTAGLGIRLNGDSGLNYYSFKAEFSGTTTANDTRGESLAVGRMGLSNIPGASAVDLTIPGAGQINIPFYSSTVNKKNANSVYGYGRGTATGSLLAGQGWGFWNNIAAVTSIDMSLSGGNFAGDSLVCLYGYA